MSNGRSLGSGGFSPAGSIVNIAVVVLVVLVLVLCAGVFLLYTQEKGVSNDAKIAKDSYNTLNASYNDLSGRYTALVSNNAELSERYNALEEDFNNVSTNYATLKNQSATSTVKIGEFLEDESTVAYNYKLTSETGANNITVLRLYVNVYNVGRSDINNAIVNVKIKSTGNNSTELIGELTNSTGKLPSLGKHTVIFDNLDNSTQVQKVLVGIG